HQLLNLIPTPSKELSLANNERPYGNFIFIQRALSKLESFPHDALIPLLWVSGLTERKENAHGSLGGDTPGKGLTNGVVRLGGFEPPTF
ncbi:MAG: hypothetical protein QF881_09290, partial [Acidimicrobiales bacterium]|nr:hypothetical protein [Acidimicrobiales bacterium]